MIFEPLGKLLNFLAERIAESEEEREEDLEQEALRGNVRGKSRHATASSGAVNKKRSFRKYGALVIVVFVLLGTVALLPLAGYCFLLQMEVKAAGKAHELDKKEIAILRTEIAKLNSRCEASFQKGVEHAIYGQIRRQCENIERTFLTELSSLAADEKWPPKTAKGTAAAMISIQGHLKTISLSLKEISVFQYWFTTVIPPQHRSRHELLLKHVAAFKAKMDNTLQKAREEDDLTLLKQQLEVDIHALINGIREATPPEPVPQAFDSAQKSPANTLPTKIQ